MSQRFEPSISGTITERSRIRDAPRLHLAREEIGRDRDPEPAPQGVFLALLIKWPEEDDEQPQPGVVSYSLKLSSILWHLGRAAVSLPILPLPNPSRFLQLRGGFIANRQTLPTAKLRGSNFKPFPAFSFPESEPHFAPPSLKCFNYQYKTCARF